MAEYERTARSPGSRFQIQTSGVIQTSAAFSMSPERLLARTLGAMQGDADTRVDELFDAWSAELPPSAAAINGKIRDVLIGQHGRTRVSALFKMQKPQVEAIMTECGAGEGWAVSLEDICGFKFASAPAPGSAHLSELSSGGAPAVVEHKYNPTLSDAIVYDLTLSDMV